MTVRLGKRRVQETKEAMKEHKTRHKTKQKTKCRIEQVQATESQAGTDAKKRQKIGLSRRELNPGLERIELMFKLDKLTY
ncbi:hypothetical protein B0T09DRAFT_154617 [Sordaria sp. MPI-SDFR-AT-0083]|nr:hypothetical protein B0T09DRAFT_154617 [Sordaria sp. MPI-SDFR-AT-0083]